MIRDDENDEVNDVNGVDGVNGDSLIENDRNSDIEIIQPNDESFDFRNEAKECDQQTLSNDENENVISDQYNHQAASQSQESTDSIKVSKEDLMRMMSEINQLKQMQLNKQQQHSAFDFIKEKEVRLTHSCGLTKDIIGANGPNGK